MPMRRRHHLRDIAAHLGQRAQVGAPDNASCEDDQKTSAASKGESGFDDSEGCKVRSRLRARLVHRRSTELAAALERKHGENWASYVMQRDFYVDEGMRRICEAFGLRPDLERRVLQATIEKASSRAAGNGIYSAQEALSYPSTGRSALDGLASKSLLPPKFKETGSADHMDEFDSESDTEGSTTWTLSGDSDCIDEDFSDHSNWELRLDHDPECQGEVASELTPTAAPELEWVTSKISASAPTPLKQSHWRARVLRTLGLEQWWSRSCHTDATAIEIEKQEDFLTVHVSLDSPGTDNAGCPAAYASNESDTDTAEECVLSSKLIAAVRNAEIQRGTASAQVISTKIVSPACDLKPNSCSYVSSNSVQFSAESHVFFFQTDVNSSIHQSYIRPLRTKFFDGPSGHKAKRSSSHPAEYPQDATIAWGNCWTDDTGSDAEDDDWEDYCDDIAELMGQQRSQLLWSAAW